MGCGNPQENGVHVSSSASSANFGRRIPCSRSVRAKSPQVKPRRPRRYSPKRRSSECQGSLHQGRRGGSARDKSLHPQAQRRRSRTRGARSSPRRYLDPRVTARGWIRSSGVGASRNHGLQATREPALPHHLHASRRPCIRPRGRRQQARFPVAIEAAALRLSRLAA